MEILNDHDDGPDTKHVMSLARADAGDAVA
jgi:hypothetical protein